MAANVAFADMGKLTGMRFTKISEFEDATMLLPGKDGRREEPITRAIPKLYSSSTIHLINRLVTSHAFRRRGVLVLIGS